MRRILFPAAILIIAAFHSVPASGQILSAGEEVPDGVVIYSLPSTSFHLEVEAVRESYVPGPYCKYANKYLGIDVPQEKGDTYQLQSIKLVPFIEADQSTRAIVNLSSFKNPPATANFFKFTAQGLVVLSDEYQGRDDNWRFPTLADNYSLNTSGVTPNFTSTETTLYKNVRNSQGGYEKVAIQQSQVVEKSLEKKAQEAATMIFDLRKKRVEIITGDTDATFSGEALGKAVDEINRLEADYLSLFIGQSQTAVQKVNFDVIPKVGERQLYVAFRVSDTQGLLLSNNVSGRPIVLELVPEAEEPVQAPIQQDDKKAKSKGQKTGSEIYYRVPKICLVRIMDGAELLLQSRVPVYQLGNTYTFPVDVMIK